MKRSLGNWLSRLLVANCQRFGRRAICAHLSKFKLYYLSRPSSVRVLGKLYASPRKKDGLFLGEYSGSPRRAPPVVRRINVRRELFLKTFETRLTSYLHFLTVNRMAGFMSEEGRLLYDSFVVCRTCLKNIFPEHLTRGVFFTRQDPQMFSIFDTGGEYGITIQST